MNEHGQKLPGQAADTYLKKKKRFLSTDTINIEIHILNAKTL